MQTRIVQRRLNLREHRGLFDTRIPAGGSWTFSYAQQTQKQAHALHVVVEVDPDQFDRNFFEEFSSSSPRARQLAQQAHARLLDSTYILFAQSISLEPSRRGEP